jgi:hypothetical protein
MPFSQTKTRPALCCLSQVPGYFDMLIPAPGLFLEYVHASARSLIPIAKPLADTFQTSKNPGDIVSQTVDTAHGVSNALIHIETHTKSKIASDPTEKAESPAWRQNYCKRKSTFKNSQSLKYIPRGRVF